MNAARVNAAREGTPRLQRLPCVGGTNGRILAPVISTTLEYSPLALALQEEERSDVPREHSRQLATSWRSPDVAAVERVLAQHEVSESDVVSSWCICLLWQ